jgi:hypothetical protein
MNGTTNTMEVKLHKFRPGDTVEIVFAVAGLADSETVVHASIEIRSRLGEILLPNRHLELVVTDAGYTGTLTTDLLDSNAVMLANLNVTTSKGRKQFLIPLGSSVHEVKIGASRKRLSMTAKVVATKQ